MIVTNDLGNYKTKISYIENDNELGYIIIEDVIDTINIIDVLVNEEYRNKRVATKLFKYLFNNYKKRFMLEVRIDNEYAIKLYNNFNFKTIHIRKGYYNGIDALIMEVNN